jgi:hypothetical protein
MVHGQANGLHGLAEDGPCDLFPFFSFLLFGLVLLDYISIFFYFYILLRCRLALPLKRYKWGMSP